MNTDEVARVVAQLNKLIEDSDKYRVLRYQYGIASRRIHELKAANALLREQLKELKDNPVKIAQVFSDPDVEPDRALVLRSSSSYEYLDQPFTIKYGAFSYSETESWWSFPDSREGHYTFADWKYWVNKYGPFTVVS